MGTKSNLPVKLQLLFVLIYLSNVGGFKSYLRLVGFGCNKLNIIAEDLKCPSEGNYTVAGACDRFVRCVNEKIQNVAKDEPYMEFCDIGENYVRGKCTKISDPYDCPQSHCRWVREDTSTPKADTTTLSSQVIVTTTTVTAEENNNPTSINKVVTNNQTANKNADFKCNEAPHVQFDDANTCPSEGKFVLFEETIECDLFVSCVCQGGRMTALADICPDNETFSGVDCVAKADISTEMYCPQMHCKANDIQKPVNHSHLHNCPKVEMEDYENEHPHGHGEDHHQHNHQSTSTVTVLQPNHSLSSTLVPFFHAVILMFVSSLVL